MKPKVGDKVLGKVPPVKGKKGRVLQVDGEYILVRFQGWKAPRAIELYPCELEIRDAT